ncbi:MAG: hypothetical protein VX498_00390 [Myxococcota bacterium]|nr:hypothetical protein [Myxococcota bacterium]
MIDRCPSLVLVALGLAVIVLLHASSDALAGEESSGVQLVDRVLASVEGSPITASQVALESQIRTQIASSPDRASFGRLLTEDVTPLEALMFREILRRLPETRTISSNESIARDRLRLFEASFGDAREASSFRARWGLRRANLLDYFKESTVLDEVISISVLVQVTEEEMRSYYDRNKNRVFADKPYEEVAEFVMRQVYRLKFEAEYNSWRTQLRAGAQKRYIGR